MHLIRTISGKETAVEADLEALGISAKLITRMKFSRPNGARRARKLREPVWSGYIFADIPDGMHKDVKAIKGVIGGSISSCNRVDRVQVYRLDELAKSGFFDDDNENKPKFEMPPDIEPGQLLKIIGGLFEGQSIAFDSLDGEKLRGEIQGRKVALDPWHVSIFR